MKNLLFTCVLIASVLPVQSTHAKLDRDRILNALLTTDFGSEIYYDDGAGDGTLITYKFTHIKDAEGNLDSEIVPDPTIKEIVSAGPAAFPLLASCIADDRLTKIRFQPSLNAAAGKLGIGHTRVPLGYVCLELLTYLSEDQSHRSSDPDDSSGDGICNDMKPGYCFRPDVLAIDVIKGAQDMKRVQANWEKLVARNVLRYRYPKMWEVYCKSCSPPH